MLNHRVEMHKVLESALQLLLEVLLKVQVLELELLLVVTQLEQVLVILNLLVEML